MPLSPPATAFGAAPNAVAGGDRGMCEVWVKTGIQAENIRIHGLEFMEAAAGRNGKNGESEKKRMAGVYAAHCFTGF